MFDAVLGGSLEPSHDLVKTQASRAGAASSNARLVVGTVSLGVLHLVGWLRGRYNPELPNCVPTRPAPHFGFEVPSPLPLALFV